MKCFNCFRSELFTVFGLQFTVYSFRFTVYSLRFEVLVVIVGCFLPIAYCV